MKVSKVVIHPKSVLPLFEKLAPAIKELKAYKHYVKYWDKKVWNNVIEHLIDARACIVLANAKRLIEAWSSAFAQCDYVTPLTLTAINELEPYRVTVGKSWADLKEYETEATKWDVYGFPT